MKQVIAAKAQNVMVEREFNGMTFKFREDGYFNAGQAAKHFKKDLENFKRLPSTKAYISALQDSLVITTDLTLIEVIPGNRYITNRGTWVHPKLAVFFARWLDPKFGVFCDMVIDDLMHGHSVLTVVAPEKAIAPKLPQTYLESLQELIESVKEQERLQAIVQQKDELLIEQAPKVEAYDRFFDYGVCMGMREVATDMGIKRDSLTAFMFDKGWIYKKPNRSVWLTYAKGRDAGYVAARIQADYYGVEREQVLITPKGVEYLMKNVPAHYYKV